MTLEHRDGHRVYTIRTTCGKPSECTVRQGETGRDSPIEWSEVPFLVQTAIEVRINENLDGVPQGLWQR